jgi:NIMA (never in mitosis gene a)-related kinase
MYDSFA